MPSATAQQGSRAAGCGKGLGAMQLRVPCLSSPQPGLRWAARSQVCGGVILAGAGRKNAGKWLFPGVPVSLGSASEGVGEPEKHAVGRDAIPLPHPAPPPWT